MGLQLSSGFENRRAPTLVAGPPSRSRVSRNHRDHLRICHAAKVSVPRVRDCCHGACGPRPHSIPAGRFETGGGKSKNGGVVRWGGVRAGSGREWHGRALFERHQPTTLVVDVNVHCSCGLLACGTRQYAGVCRTATPTRYANPLRQSTTPIHYANPLRQSTTWSSDRWGDHVVARATLSLAECGAGGTSLTNLGASGASG